MKYLLIGLPVLILVIFIGLQFPSVYRKIDRVDLNLSISASKDVDIYLRDSCYSCHSDEINWTWYSYIAPISWYVVTQARDGRTALNFSRWKEYDQNKVEALKNEIISVILGKNLPISVRGVKHVSPPPQSLLSQAAVEWFALYAGNSQAARNKTNNNKQPSNVKLSDNKPVYQ